MGLGFLPRKEDIISSSRMNVHRVRQFFVSGILYAFRACMVYFLHNSRVLGAHPGGLVLRYETVQPEQFLSVEVDLGRRCTVSNRR